MKMVKLELFSWYLGSQVAYYLHFSQGYLGEIATQDVPLIDWACMDSLRRPVGIHYWPLLISFYSTGNSVSLLTRAESYHSWVDIWTHYSRSIPLWMWHQGIPFFQFHAIYLLSTLLRTCCHRSIASIRYRASHLLGNRLCIYCH